MKISANSLSKELFQSSKPLKQSPTDKMIDTLNKQKSRLQDEIKKLNDSKDDEATRKSRKEKLQSQIDAIDKQVATLQMEKLKQASEMPKEAATNLGSENTQYNSGQPVGVPLAESKHFMRALNKNDNLKTMKKVHTAMLGKAHAAMGSVSPNGATIAEQDAIMAPVREFEDKMKAKAGEIQDELKKAAREIDQKKKQKKEEEKVQEEKEAARETEDTQKADIIPTDNGDLSNTIQTNDSGENKASTDSQQNQSQSPEILQYKKFSPEIQEETKKKLDFNV